MKVYYDTSVFIPIIYKESLRNNKEFGIYSDNVEPYISIFVIEEAVHSLFYKIRECYTKFIEDATKFFNILDLGNLYSLMTEFF